MPCRKQPSRRHEQPLRCMSRHTQSYAHQLYLVPLTLPTSMSVFWIGPSPQYCSLTTLAWCRGTAAGGTNNHTGKCGKSEGSHNNQWSKPGPTVGTTVDCSQTRILLLQVLQVTHNTYLNMNRQTIQMFEGLNDNFYFFFKHFVLPPQGCS